MQTPAFFDRSVQRRRMSGQEVEHACDRGGAWKPERGERLGAHGPIDHAAPADFGKNPGIVVHTRLFAYEIEHLVAKRITLSENSGNHGADIGNRDTRQRRFAKRQGDDERAIRLPLRRPAKKILEVVVDADKCCAEPEAAGVRFDLGLGVEMGHLERTSGKGPRWRQRAHHHVLHAQVRSGIEQRHTLRRFARRVDVLEVIGDAEKPPTVRQRVTHADDIVEVAVHDFGARLREDPRGLPIGTPGDHPDAEGSIAQQPHRNAAALATGRAHHENALAHSPASMVADFKSNPGQPWPPQPGNPSALDPCAAMRHGGRMRSGPERPTGRAALRWRQFLVFTRNFLRHPLTVGTFAPSSPFLVRRLLRDIDWSQVRCVVEYGPGVGTITSALLRRMHPDARLLVIEMNREFCEFMRTHIEDPRLRVIHGSAEDVLKALAEAGLDAADLIVSGIPFSTMPKAVRGRVLDATATALAAEGQFLVYQYTRSVLQHLVGRFRIVWQDTEWRNAWPMRLFMCQKLA